jgi:hypothetical protein
MLGYNPVSTLLGPALAHLPAARAVYLTGRSFFPSVISPAFGHGLAAAFDFAIAACLIAAAVSLLRGRTYAYGAPRPPPHPRRRKPPAAARNVLTAACRTRFCQEGAPPHPGMGNPTHSPAHAQPPRPGRSARPPGPAAGDWPVCLWRRVRGLSNGPIERQAIHDGRAGSGGAVDDGRSADCLHAVTQADEAGAPGRIGAADAVVADR